MNLYPTFEIPSLDTEDENQQPTFKPSPLFDYDSGDFVRDGANRIVYVSGREAYILWCIKTLQTQAGGCLAYMDVGIDAEEVMQQPDRASAQSVLERTVTEALMANPCTERVYDFEFEWEADAVHVTFWIKAASYAAFKMDMSIEM